MLEQKQTLVQVRNHTQTTRDVLLYEIYKAYQQQCRSDASSPEHRLELTVDWASHLVANKKKHTHRELCVVVFVVFFPHLVDPSTGVAE